MITEGSLEEIYHNLGLLQVVHVQVLNLTQNVVENVARIPGVQDVEQQVDRLAVRLRAEDLAAEDLLEAMLALGCRIRMFQPEAMDMETAFMKLTAGTTA
jgi:ABC-2 type transport system ATP-binding protein